MVGQRGRPPQAILIQRRAFAREKNAAVLGLQRTQSKDRRFSTVSESIWLGAGWTADEREKWADVGLGMLVGTGKSGWMWDWNVGGNGKKWVDVGLGMVVELERESGCEFVVWKW